MVSGDTRTQTSVPLVEASPAPLEQPASGALGRNLEGYRWIRRDQEAFTESALQERLLGGIRSWRDYPPSLRLWFWLIPVITAAIGGVLRFVRLDTPHSLVFDENYYVKDGYSLLVSGHERSWPDEANDSFNAGNPAVLLDTPQYVVRPPVGKWMIAAGMWLFGPAAVPGPLPPGSVQVPSGTQFRHPYEASAWSWLVMGRPTSFFYESPKQGSPGCDVASCTSAILSVGNPLIWWSATVSLVILLFWWAGRTGGPAPSWPGSVRATSRGSCIRNAPCSLSTPCPLNHV